MSYYDVKTNADIPAIIQKGISATSFQLSEVQLIGSYSQVTLPFWSDIDINDKVYMGYNSVANELQKKFHELAVSPSVHFSDGNVLKAIKRAWSIARLGKDTPVLEMIHPLLLSDIQRLSVIKSDLETTLLAFSKFPSFLLQEMVEELNVFKDEISTMATDLSESTRESLISTINGIIALNGGQGFISHLIDELEELTNTVTTFIAQELKSSIKYRLLEEWVGKYLKKFL